MKSKKILALVLSVLMVLGMVPFTAISADTHTETTTNETTTHTPHVEPTLTSDKVVFVSGAGSNDNDGESPDAPVKTLTYATELLGDNGGTIVVCGAVAIADEPLSTYEYTSGTTTQTLVDGRYQMPAHKGLVYITTVYDEVDYGADCGATISFGKWNDHGTEKSHHFIIGGPTTFEKITFTTEANPVFYGRGHFLTMGEGVSSGNNMYVVGYEQTTFHTTGENMSTNSDTHIIIKSGNYDAIVGMARSATDGTYMGTAYITVNGGTITYLAGLGANTTGGYYGNAVIEINGGSFTNIAGAAYSCTKGDFGNVTMTINNATVSEDANNKGSTGRTAGMSHSGSYNKFGDVKITVNNGTFKSFEGYSFGTTYSVYGNSDITINNGKFDFVNGVQLCADNANTYNIYADAKTTVNSATLSNYLCGGSYRNSFTADSVTLNINGGTYAKTVCGLNITGDTVIKDDITLNITDGTFSSYVCAGSYGNNSSYTTSITGGADVHINISGGNLKMSGASLMIAYKCTSNPQVGRVYYNVSGGTIDKIYVGSRNVPAVKCDAMFFTYSGGSIRELSTARLTGYQKYYFVGEKTYETTKFSAGTVSDWPGPGHDYFNYVNLGETYPEAIYVKNVNDGGDYVNDGLTPETPVESVYDAAVALGPNGGTIYLMSDLPGIYTPKTSGTITYSAILPGETEPNGYGFNLDNSNLYLNSDVVFDGITFRSTKTERLIAFQGHNVTINDNCQMILANEETGTVGYIGLIMGYSQNSDNYWVGGRTADQVSVYNDQTVNINGGEWVNLYGGNRRYGQAASVGTYYGDVVINIGEGATFNSHTPADDTYPANAVFLVGSNIVKGNVTANLAGTFNSLVYGVGKLNILYNGVSTTSNGKDVHYFGTDGITMRDGDTRFEANITVNATGNFTLEGGCINAILKPGDTPLYGSFTLNTDGATFADGFKSDAKGVIGTTTYTGSADVETVNYTTANGKANKNSDPIRVITVGDSITWGTCSTDNEVDGYKYSLYNYNYPAQLQKLLGEGAVVGNFGYPGARAHYGVYNDYFGSSSYGFSMQFGDADAIIIALGTNECKGIVNAGGPENYESSMRRLIEGYHAAYPNATIYITTALPRFGDQNLTDAVEQLVMPIQVELAGDYEYTELMDLYTAMLPYAEVDKADNSTIYFADKLHPTNLGYGLMAEAVAGYLTEDFCYYAHTHIEPTCTDNGCDKYSCLWCDAEYNENKTDALGHDIYEVERVEATTESDGYVHYACTRCDYTITEILPIIGKTYTEFEVFAPTCTEQGFTRHYCDQDDSYYDDAFIPALGHDEVTVTVAVGCVNDGSITTTCTRCDYENVEIIPATGHTAGDAATCTKDQVCTVCGVTLVEAFGHDNTSVVIAPTATTAGYTLTTCSRCDTVTKSNWVDATDKIVVFVKTSATTNGDGSIDAPFNTYTEACLYADTSFDRIIVLMDMVKLTADYTERNHTGHYTVTSIYNDVDYDGGFNVTGAFHYILSGDTTIENVDFNLASTLVFRCKFNTLVMGEGIECSRKGLYVVGADQDSKSTADATQDVNFTILSGKYVEVVGGYRAGGPFDITGTINIHIGGTAEIDKLFIGNRSLTSKHITHANLTLDGGIIHIFVAASDVQRTTAETGAPRGTVIVNVTRNFDVSKSFNGEGGVSFAGFSLSTAIMKHEVDTLNTWGTYILNIDAYVYDEIMASGKVNEISINKISKIGEVLAGDFDCDEALTNADIAILVRYLAGWDVDAKIVDLNEDGKINNRDAITLIKKVAGWVVVEPEEVEIPSSYNLQFSNSKIGIYNYCPSIMQVSEDTRYIYYCTNQRSYNVTDYIGCRKATLGADGNWTWGEETLVLSPTSGTWDSRHVCDPSVVKGEFNYGGETYSYLMAYLGCDTSNSQENEIGLAVAKSPEGPFVKVGNAPFIAYERDMTIDQNLFQWGAGQPSLINMDKKGDMMVFYTLGDPKATRTIVERWDLTNLDAPVRKSSQKLSATGLENLNGGKDIMNNADFVYDAEAQRFYASSDCHPNPTDAPDFISSHFRVTYFEQTANYSAFTWKTLTVVGPEETGFARNHNTGILRDAYGHLANGYITVYYTVSVTGGQDQSLYSYKIYDYNIGLAK